MITPKNPPPGGRPPPAKVYGEEFNCGTCGARLPLTGDKRVVNCDFCGAENAVPEKLWKMIAPPPTLQQPQLFQQQYPPPHYTPPHVPPGTPPHMPHQHFPQTPFGRNAGVKPSKARFLPFIFIFLVPLIGGGSALLSYFKTSGGMENALSGHAVYGNGADIISPSAVAPSWESADPLATAKNIMAMVKKNWKGKIRAGEMRFYKVKTDGTINVGEENDSSMMFTFYNTRMFKKVLPGENAAKNAVLTINIADNIMASNIGDLDVSHIKDLKFVDELPSCDIKSLFSAAVEAGYPSVGFADLNFPDVPHQLSNDYFKSRLSYHLRDKKGRYLKDKEAEKVWKKMTGAGWKEDLARSYYYYVKGIESANRPMYFSVHDCKPTDTDAALANILEKYAGK
ncbi:MAG: hypothetical protein ABIJ56_07955 [Pseudomonadota bacterium]